MMRLVVITGSLPPIVCGCGDYVQALVRELKQKDVKTELFFRRDWRLSQLPGYISEIRKSQATAINIQYPTQGYRWSVVPMLLCLFLRRGKKVVTLHEFSRLRIEARIAIYMFFLSSDWVIFTTEVERGIACRFAPWLRAKSSVIPIGSNIPLLEAQQPDTDIVYFGLIHPAKGLEEFIATLSSVTTGKELRIRVIGQIAPGYEGYAAQILPQLRALGVQIILDRSAEDVSQMLSRARIALLPFPDGMSRRRGSALASMGNGALLVTTAAQMEVDLFRGICAMPASGATLCELLVEVLEHYDSYDSIRRAGQAFAQSISWSGVADEYIKVVSKLLTDGG